MGKIKKSYEKNGYEMSRIFYNDTINSAKQMLSGIKSNPGKMSGVGLGSELGDALHDLKKLYSEAEKRVRSGFKSGKWQEFGIISKQHKSSAA